MTKPNAPDRVWLRYFGDRSVFTYSKPESVAPVSDAAFVEYIRADVAGERWGKGHTAGHAEGTRDEQQRILKLLRDAEEELRRGPVNACAHILSEIIDLVEQKTP